MSNQPAGHAVYREGDLQLVCDSRTEEGALSLLRTMLDIPLSKDGLEFEPLDYAELREMIEEVEG